MLELRVRTQGLHRNVTLLFNRLVGRSRFIHHMRVVSRDSWQELLTLVVPSRGRNVGTTVSQVESRDDGGDSSLFN